MIEAEELSFRDWECFEHMQHQREENRITLPNLDQHSSRSSTREETAISSSTKAGHMDQDLQAGDG